MTCFLFYLDNISEIYFDNFFDVVYEIEKNMYSDHVPPCVSKMDPHVKSGWKALNYVKNAVIEKNTSEEKTKGAAIRKSML